MPKNENVETTVGDVTVAFLEACGLSTAFGVISIHNMPILDAIARRGNIRFVPARGEAGALNMADAFARVSGGLGVGVTSTGVAAGNAAGSMVEALTAGTPVLHLTGQIELPYLDQARSYIHEAAKQPDMLKAVSKASFRIWSPDQALGVLREAVRTALTPPMGPVSVEIPIDVQGAPLEIPADLAPSAIPAFALDEKLLSVAADELAEAKRPLLWLGGGARGAGKAARRLAEMGIGVVTSTQGRGVVPEDHPMSLGSFNVSPSVEKFYATCDLMMVVGSRLRGNETLKYSLSLPERRIQVDVDSAMDGRSYKNDLFIHAEAEAFLTALADKIEGSLSIDSNFSSDLALAKNEAVEGLRTGLGAPYETIVDAVRASFPAKSPWVRDITVSNSTWGNRFVPLSNSRQGVHSLGGAIGQGMPMAIGAAIAAANSDDMDNKVVVLAGDGGFMVNPGELATAAQERADITIILMNDGGYGVIRNIQDALYGGRQVYADLLTPDFGHLCAAVGIERWLVETPEAFQDALDSALAVDGPSMVEVDMRKIGPYARAFAGPPVKK